MDTADVWMCAVMREWGKAGLAGLAPHRAALRKTVVALRGLHEKALQPSLQLTPKRVAVVKAADQAAR